MKVELIPRENKEVQIISWNLEMISTPELTVSVFEQIKSGLNVQLALLVCGTCLMLVGKRPIQLTKVARFSFLSSDQFLAVVVAQLVERSLQVSSRDPQFDPRQRQNFIYQPMV